MEKRKTRNRLPCQHSCWRKLLFNNTQSDICFVTSNMLNEIKQSLHIFGLPIFFHLDTFQLHSVPSLLVQVLVAPSRASGNIISRWYLNSYCVATSSLTKTSTWRTCACCSNGRVFRYLCPFCTLWHQLSSIHSGHLSRPNSMLRASTAVFPIATVLIKYINICRSVRIMILGVTAKLLLLSF